MSTKYELASYLSSLISIMESKEDAGRPRGTTIGAEYDWAYAELMQKIGEDNEARQRNEKLQGKDRTNLKEGGPRGGLATGYSPRREPKRG